MSYNLNAGPSGAAHHGWIYGERSDSFTILVREIADLAAELNQVRAQSLPVRSRSIHCVRVITGGMAAPSTLARAPIVAELAFELDRGQSEPGAAPIRLSAWLSCSAMAASPQRQVLAEPILRQVEALALKVAVRTDALAPLGLAAGFPRAVLPQVLHISRIRIQLEPASAWPAGDWPFLEDCGFQVWNHGKEAYKRLRV